MEVKVAVVTVRLVVALMPAKAAETVVLPAATPVATPALSAELLTVATEGVDEVHVTADVKSNCSPSLNVPIAVSWVSIVAGSLRLCGVILIDTKLDPSTTRGAEALIVPIVAVIVAAPADCPVTTPEVPTVATLVSDDDQVEYTFTFCVLLSVHSAFALKGRAAPGARVALVLLAEIEIELRVAELTVKDVLPVALAPAKLKEAVTLVVPCLIPSMMPMLLPGVPKLATVGVAALHATEVLIS